MRADYGIGFGLAEAGHERLVRVSHGQHSFWYRCFDRILLNELIQPFQQPERVVGFFNTYRHLYPAPTWCSPRNKQQHPPRPPERHRPSMNRADN